MYTALRRIVYEMYASALRSWHMQTDATDFIDSDTMDGY